MELRKAAALYAQQQEANLTCIDELRARVKALEGAVEAAPLTREICQGRPCEACVA